MSIKIDGDALKDPNINLLVVNLFRTFKNFDKELTKRKICAIYTTNDSCVHVIIPIVSNEDTLPELMKNSSNIQNTHVKCGYTFQSDGSMKNVYHYVFKLSENDNRMIRLDKKSKFLFSTAIFFSFLFMLLFWKMFLDSLIMVS